MLADNVTGTSFLHLMHISQLSDEGIFKKREMQIRSALCRNQHSVLLCSLFEK